VLLAAPFLAQADATIANVATPAIRTDLHASPAAVELVIGGYLVTYAALLITGARLGQTHGYKRLFLLGVTLFGISSLVGGLAPNPAVLIAMRVLQGAAAALMYPQTLTGIQLTFTGRERARAIGLFAIALSTGAVVGQILGGVLVSADLAGTGWRPIFLVNVPICLGVALAALRVLPTDAPPGGARLDIPGVLALTATVLLVVVPLTLGHAEGWPVWTWLCLTAAAPTFWLFLTGQRRRQARGAAPLIDIHVVRRPPVLLGLLALLTTTGTYYALLFTLAQYIQQGLGRGALASGLLLVPWVAAFGIAGQITRRLPPRATPLLPAIGYALLTIAYLTIGVLLYTGRPGDGWLIPLLGLGGLGLGTGFATLLTHLTNAVPASNAPDISGVSTTTTQIGGAIGVAAFGGLYFALAHQPGDETQARHAFAITCIALAAATLTAILTAHLATHRRPADSATTEAYCG
jgi:predicted MFS family arabinose efflux permease